MCTRRGKVHVVQNQVQAADVAVINIRHWPGWAVAILYALFGMSLPLMAAILPEDRADILYHRYDGDQVTVDGPSILIIHRIPITLVLGTACLVI